MKAIPKILCNLEFNLDDMVDDNIGVDYKYLKIDQLNTENFNGLAIYVKGLLDGTPPSGPAVFADVFDYSNGDLATHAPWENAKDAIDVISKQVAGTTVIDITMVTVAQADFADDQEVQIEFAAISDNDNLGVVARGDLTGNGYVGLYDEVNDEVTINTSALGVLTPIATGDQTLVVTDIIKLKCIGDVISLEVDSGAGFVESLSVTDASISSGQAGIFYNRQNVNGTRGINFLASDIVVEGQISLGYESLYDGVEGNRLPSDEMTWLVDNASMNGNVLSYFWVPDNTIVINQPNSTMVNIPFDEYDKYLDETPLDFNNKNSASDSRVISYLPPLVDILLMQPITQSSTIDMQVTVWGVNF